MRKTFYFDFANRRFAIGMAHFAVLPIRINQLLRFVIYSVLILFTSGSIIIKKYYKFKTSIVDAAIADMRDCVQTVCATYYLLYGF